MTGSEAANRAVYLLKLAVLLYPAVRPAALAKHKPPRSVDEALAELDGPHHPAVAALIGSELAALRACGVGASPHSPLLAEGLGPVIRDPGRRPAPFPKREDAAHLFNHLRAMGAGYRQCEAIVWALLGVESGELSRSRSVNDGSPAGALALYALAAHKEEVLTRLGDINMRDRPAASVFAQPVARNYVRAFRRAASTFGRRDHRARRWLRRALCGLVPLRDAGRAAHALRVHQLLSIGPYRPTN